MARMRWRTAERAGNRTGQPALASGRAPLAIAQAKVVKPGVCSECFKPKSTYNKRPFCETCLAVLFGPARGGGYDTFISEEKGRRRNLEAQRKRRAEALAEAEWLEEQAFLDFDEE
jgi:hypothetical protein